MDIKDLSRQGLSQRAIARQTGHSRNTVARALSQKTPQSFARPERVSALDPFKPYLKNRHAEVPLSSLRLLAEIQAMGFSGGIDVVRLMFPARGLYVLLYVCASRGSRRPVNAAEQAITVNPRPCYTVQVNNLLRHEEEKLKQSQQSQSTIDYLPPI